MHPVTAMFLLFHLQRSPPVWLLDVMLWMSSASADTQASVQPDSLPMQLLENVKRACKVSCILNSMVFMSSWQSSEASVMVLFSCHAVQYAYMVWYVVEWCLYKPLCIGSGSECDESQCPQPEECQEGMVYEAGFVLPGDCCPTGGMCVCDYTQCSDEDFSGGCPLGTEQTIIISANETLGQCCDVIECWPGNFGFSLFIDHQIPCMQWSHKCHKQSMAYNNIKGAVLSSQVDYNDNTLATKERLYRVTQSYLDWFS